MSELKSCPFCGGQAITDEHHEDNGMPEVYYREYHYYMVRCKECGAQLTDTINMERVMRAWNRRTDTQHPH